MADRVIADLMTLPELAEELNVTPRTIMRWHARRQGPPRIRVGGRVYFRAGAVRDWLLAKEKSEPRSSATNRKK